MYILAATYVIENLVFGYNCCENIVYSVTAEDCAKVFVLAGDGKGSE